MTLPVRVLCVDDDRVNLLLIEQVFRQLDGVALVCAESGVEALALANACRPDLLVIDLHLPDTDGLALLPRLRSALAAPGLPAILCTAEHPQDVAESAAQAGYHRTWSKPVTLDQVRAAVRDLLTPPAPAR